MASERTTDKRTIGIASGHERVLQALGEAGLFGSEVEAAKFAMAHAIDAGVGKGATEGAETKWNVGTVDPDGTLRAVVQALFPEERQPYRLVEYLMNEGLRLLDSGEGLAPDVAGMMMSTDT